MTLKPRWSSCASALPPPRAGRTPRCGRSSVRPQRLPHKDVLTSRWLTNSPRVAGGLKRSQLKKRARAAGVDEALLEEAEDGPNAIADIIELIVEAAPADEPADAAAAARRAELLAMKLSALKREARGAGVAADLLDAAVDGENPRAGLVDLILSAAPAPDAADGPLRAELAGMRLSALSKRAEQAGG